MNKGWSLDIAESDEFESNDYADDEEIVNKSRQPESAVHSFEERIRDPSLDALQATNAENDGHKLEVSSLDTQAFLAIQLEVLEKMRQGAEDSDGMGSSRQIRGRNDEMSMSGGDEAGVDARVNEHIGPVQFNMGGIQVDADDMLQRLKVCVLLSSYRVSGKLIGNRIDKHIQVLNQAHRHLRIRCRMKSCLRSLRGC